jgi:hypothetical protein
VIAEGPETPEEIEQILRHVGPQISALKVLITARYETALARAVSDPSRGVSKDPDFLRRMYQRFEGTRADIAHDLEFDTEELTSTEIAQRVIEGLPKLGQRGSPGSRGPPDEASRSGKKGARLGNPSRAPLLSTLGHYRPWAAGAT